METLSADMASLMSSKKASASILDVVGADVNSSYDRAMQIQLVSDTFHISSGGQEFGGNYNIQIQLRDDNAIHYLKNSGLVFDLNKTAGAFLHSASYLFTGLELAIGNVVVSTPFQHFYAAQKLVKKSKKRVQKYARSMALKLDDFNVLSAHQVQNEGTNNAIIVPLVPLLSHGGQAPPVYVGIAQAQSNHYHSRHRQLAEFYQQCAETGGILPAEGERVKCFVPFHEIFPLIEDLPDDGALYTGYGQAIKMNIRTNMASDCLNTAVAFDIAPNYSIKNMQLLKVFSKLDQPRADLILKSSISLPLCKYVHWQQQVSTSTINAIYSVSKDDLITGLVFGFHTRTGCSNSTLATNIVDNLTNGAIAQYKSPLSYFPQFPVMQIDLHIGGEPIIINMQQIQALHLLEGLSGEDLLYDDPIMRQTKYAYKIDLRRFADDLFGSSAKQTTTVQVQITLKTDAGSRTLFQQAADWTSILFQNFSFYSYLECLNFVELKNGVYQAK